MVSRSRWAAAVVLALCSFGVVRAQAADTPFATAPVLKPGDAWVVDEAVERDVL